MMTTSCSRTGFKEKWLPFMMSATLSGLLCASSTNADYPLAVEERSASSERIIDSFLPADIHAASSMESLRQIADANPAHVFAVFSIMASKRLRELPLKKLESTQYSDYTAGNASLFLERLEFDEDGFITSESFRNAAHEAVLGFSESDEVVIIETQFLPEGPLGTAFLWSGPLTNPDSATQMTSRLVRKFRFQARQRQECDWNKLRYLRIISEMMALRFASPA